MLRDAVRALLANGLGPAGRALLAWRTRGQAERLLASRGLVGAGDDLDAHLASTVARGPFAGLVYPRHRGDIVHAAKLIGAYERELHDSVERLIARAPALVINVGSGDGYYAVGFARRLPRARVIAVDPDPLAQHACDRTAGLNGVRERMQRVVRLDAKGLQQWLALTQERTLCLVDCEGYEDVLLDPTAAPALRRADLLVETHDFAAPGVTSRLTDRFMATHDVVDIAIAARDRSRYPELASLDPRIADGLLDEFRHQPQGWLVCLARD